MNLYNSPVWTVRACKLTLLVCFLVGILACSEAVIVCDSDPVPVTLTATPSTLYFPTTNTALLVFRLSSAVDTDTLLGLSYSGTASNGVDVQKLPSAGIFPAGHTVGTLPVVPLATNSAQVKILTVTISSSGNPCVYVGSPNSASIYLVPLTGALPLITAQPQSQAVVVQSPAQLSVSAVGSPPLRFQWLKDGGPVNRATNSTLAFAQAQLSDSGAYSVVVSNAAGSLVSSNATLKVRPLLPGDLDISFNSGLGPGAATVNALLVQPDGKLLIGGGFFSVDHVVGLNLARLNLDDSLDNNFKPGIGTSDTVSAMALQPDGKILAGGQFRNGKVVRLNSDGSLDPTFNAVLGGAEVRTLALQLDGKILFGGSSPPIGRLNPDGSSDTNFAAATLSFGFGPPIIQALAVKSDGKVLAGGRFSTVNGSAHGGIMRLYSDGSLDASFNPNAAQVTTILLQPNGQILIGEAFSAFISTNRLGIVRLNPDGTLDDSFNRGRGLGVEASSAPLSLALEPTGKIILGGSFETFNGVGRTNIARLNPDGSLDTGFDPGTGANPGGVYSVALQPDGHVVIGGTFSYVNRVFRPGLARLVGGDFPLISYQPQSQFANQGDTVTFAVTATAYPSPQFQWLKNGTNISGATGSTFILANVQKNDAGAYSVLVSNRLGSVTSSNATLRVNLPPVADAGATRTLCISANGTNATVILDGSRSYDPDGDPLQYGWYKVGSSRPLASGVVAIVVLPVGANSILLVVSDGMAARTNAITVQIITTAQAVERLLALVSSGSQRPQPLLATLRAAFASIDRANSVSAVNQLVAFENQVRAQVAPVDGDLARALIASAQQVIGVLSGGNLNPGGHLRAGITSMTRLPNGHVRMQITAELGAACIVEASTNLTDWEMVGMATPQPDGSLAFEDRPPTSRPQRFYRLVVLP